MRGFVPIVLAGAAIMSLPASAQVDDSPPVGHACSGVAYGDHGERVTVILYTPAAGNRTTAQARWLPPQSGNAGLDGFERPDIRFEISYQNSTVTAPGKISFARLTVSLVSPPSKSAHSGQLAARLGRYTIQYRFDGAPFVSLADRTADDAWEPLPGSAEREADIALTEPVPTRIDFQVLDTKGKLVSTAQFNLAQTSSRDALFGDAWAIASRASAKPIDCEPIWDDGTKPVLII